LPIQCQVLLALLPGSEAVGAHANGHRPSGGEDFLQSPRPRLSRTEVPAIDKNAEPTLAHPTRQLLRVCVITPVVTDEELEVVQVSAVQKAWMLRGGHE
jgi:hypothetical protein